MNTGRVLWRDRSQKCKHCILTSAEVPLLLLNLISRYKKQFIVSGVIKLVNSAVQFLPSLLVSKILKLGAPGTLGGKAEVNRGLMLAMLLFISLSTKTVIENVYFDMVTNLAAQIRGTLSAAIYQKALRLGPEGRQNVTVSELIHRRFVCSHPTYFFPISLTSDGRNR